MKKIVTIWFDLIKLERETTELLKKDKAFVGITEELESKYKNVITI